MVTMKNRNNKGYPDPKLDASKHQEGYAKLRQLSSLSILPSGKPEAKQMPINQLTIVPPASIKSEQKSVPRSAKSPKMNPALASSFPKTVPRASIQKPTHPLKAKISPIASKLAHPRPGPKSKTKILSNKPVNVPALFTLGQLSEMKKNIRINMETEVSPVVKTEINNVKDVVPTNANNIEHDAYNELEEDSDEIIIVEEGNITETVQDKFMNSDNEVLAEIMKQVEDLENSFKGDLEIKKKEFEHLKVFAEKLKGKNRVLEDKLNLSLDKRNSKVDSLKLQVETLEQEQEMMNKSKEIITKEIEDNHKQMEAFKSSNEVMMQKIIRLNDENTDIDEKYKNVLQDMDEMKDKKDAEIKKERDSLKAVLQKHISNENTLKQTIKMFEKIVKEKGDDLQKEYEIVDQLKKKNEVLENSEKKSKLLLKKKESEIESLKSQSKKNTDIFAKKLKQKQEDLDDQVQMYTSMQKNLDSLETQKVILENKLIEKDDEINSIELKSKRSSDLMNKKEEELNESNKMLEKVSKDLEKMEEWKVTEVEREKNSLITMIQKNLKESAIFKGQIDNLENSVKNKDELLSIQNTKIELLDKKIVEKDKLFKDLKVKVSKLITEFTKGLKEKGELLLTKNHENNAALLKIEMLENKISSSAIERKEAMKKIYQFNRIIVDLSSKITKLKHEQKNEAILTVMTEKQLQNNVIELQKRDKKKSETVKKLQNEIRKWQTLEELRSKQNTDATNNVMDNLNEMLMLTYLWPIVPYKDSKSKIIIIGLPLLKSLDLAIVIRVVYPPEPLLMITYLWPVVWVRNFQKSTENLPKTHKRKLLNQLTPLATKRICLSHIQPPSPHFKNMKSLLETIPVSVVASHQPSMPLLCRSSQTLKLKYQWPITKYQPAVNLTKPTEMMFADNCAQETSVQYPKKVCLNSKRGLKRKFEETDMDTNKAKKIKMIQERIIKTMAINLCNDRKVREHVNRQFALVQTKAIFPETKISPISPSTLLSPLIQHNQPPLQLVSYQSKPYLMITYLWPIVLSKRTLKSFVEEIDVSLVKENVLVCPEITISIIDPPQPLLMITYMWPIVLAKRPLKVKSQVMPHFPLLKSLNQEITISIIYPTPPLLMITYMWPIVEAKPCIGNQSIDILNKAKATVNPCFPLLMNFNQDLIISVSYPPKPILMITYLWPIALVRNSIENCTTTSVKKRKCTDELNPLPKRSRIMQVPHDIYFKIPSVKTMMGSEMICDSFSYSSTRLYVLAKIVEEVQENGLSYSEENTFNQETCTVPMISYLWPLVPYNEEKVSLKRKRFHFKDENESKRIRLSKVMDMDLAVSNLTKSKAGNLFEPIPLMLTYLWPIVPSGHDKLTTTARVKHPSTVQVLYGTLPIYKQFLQKRPSLRSMNNIPKKNSVKKALAMIGYNWPIAVLKEPCCLNNRMDTRGRKRKICDFEDDKVESLSKKIRLVSETQLNNSQNLQLLFEIQKKNSEKINLIFAKQASNRKRMQEISRNLLDFNPNTRFTKSCKVVTFKPIATPLMISYNWPISVYKERNNVEMAKSEPEKNKRQMNESNAGISKGLKRKLEETEENESLPKRIKEQKLKQKIQERIIKMMTINLCNDKIVLEQCK